MINKYLISKLLIVFLFITSYSFAGKNHVSLVSERGEETVLRFTMSESDYVIKAIDVDGKKLDLISLSHAAYDEPKSFPHVPRIAQSMIIPDKAKMQLEIVDVKYTEISVNTVAPSKGSLSRKINPADVPYEFGEIYTQAGWYPAQCAKLGQPYISRVFRANVVYFQPFLYNPQTKTLKICTEITVKVSSTNEIGFNVKNRIKPLKIGPNFHQIYSRRFINYSSKRYTPVDEEGTMLIISHGDFMATMEPFVAWKNKRGLKTELVNISDVSDISSYVADYYNNKDLKYLLLVGDDQQVPTSSSGGDPSDNKYCCLEGSDSYVEAFAGRFSGTDVSHIQTQVDKVLHYERELGGSDAWLNKGYGTYSSSEQDDKDAIAHIKSDLEAFTYTTVNTGGSEQRDLIGDIGQGIGVHINSSHGNKTSIAGLRTSNVPSLNNDGMYPFNFTLACNPGEFDGSGDCLGEAVLKKEGGGYIGAFMASISQPWNEPYAGIHEHTDILTEQYPDNIKRTYGGIAHNGCGKMIDDYSNQGPWVSDCWVLFGDPSLLVYTDAPKPIEINHPPSVGNGSQTVDVTGTEDATVCMYNEKLGIQELKKLTGGSASFTLEITATELDSIHVTATAFNYETYEGAMSIVTGPYISVSSPKNGDEYWAGDEVTIEWDTGGGATVSEVKIEYSTDNGSSYETIESSVSNTGSYKWTVPDVNESDECLIKVSDANGDLVDESGVFSIKQKAAISLNVTSYDGALKPNTSMVKPLKITNKGKGKLEFKVSIGGPAGEIKINEIYCSESEIYDGLELPNVGADMDMSGWKVEWKDDQNTSGSYSFPANYVFPSGKLIVLMDVTDETNDSTFYVGTNMYWDQGTTELSIAVLDEDGLGVDFVRTAGNNDEPPEGTEWSGTGVALSNDVAYRNSNDDKDDATDWSLGAASAATLHALNPGQSRADYWLSIDPTEGTVDPLSNTELTVTFDAADLAEDTYYDTIYVEHNDPDQDSPIIIPVKLKVDPNTAILDNNSTSDGNSDLLSIGPCPAVTEVHFMLASTENIEGAVLRIYDAISNLLYKTDKLLPTGHCSWNLKVGAGKTIGGGAYLVLVELTYGDGSVKEVKKLFGVKED